jgi:hypothetical protein
LTFRVTADTLADYLDFDRARRRDLVRLHALIRKAAPSLRRHFHRGTPAGEAGMRMKMIGYGKFRYAIKSGKGGKRGKAIDWPVVGVALQKNYISVHVAVTKAGKPIVSTYAGKLGELRTGHNNFSFRTFDELDATGLSSLLAEVALLFASDPDNPVRYMQGSA